MNKKSFILAILLISIVCFSSSCVFAQDSQDIQSADADVDNIQQSNDIATISQSNDDGKLSATYTITAGSDSETIQNTINSMNDGDTLNFENGTYNDICIYINKSITINGNGAILNGYDTPSKDNTPSIIWNSTSQGGFGISNLATLYLVKATNVTVNGLTIIGGAHSGSLTGPEYSNALIYVTGSPNFVLDNNVLIGSSWSIYSNTGSPDAKITNNLIKDSAVAGMIDFGSPRMLIENNTIINAANHGIDVRHGGATDVQIINNTIVNSKEGIYLMHSQRHTAAKNTIINCTTSAISCYGSKHVQLLNNTIYKSRLGLLLSGGYTNITVKGNTFDLQNLPFPPTFVYFVGEGKTDFNSYTKMMGTHSDSSSYSPTYVEYSEISAPKNITVDYNTILTPTGTLYEIPEGATGDEIQAKIDAMKDGDTLSFAKNAVYENISIYADKNIKIIGNNATLIGVNSINMNYVPEKIKAQTADGGYAITYRAVLYVLNNTNAVVTGLNIIAQYPGYNINTAGALTDEYKTVGIYTKASKNVTITKNSITGASWGILVDTGSHNAIITNNNIQDQYTTGILNFGSSDSIIANNTITNATNHGIDVRHGSGPRATVFNNTITGAQEGIYLMHSQGHKVYNNTLVDCTISSITCYGSGNEFISNNTLIGSEIGILLGGGYYNVTIGENIYDLYYLPFPYTFETALVKAESKFQSQSAVSRVYSDKEKSNLAADNITVANERGTFKVTITDSNGVGINRQIIDISINGTNHTVKTNANGIATLDLNLTSGEYVAEIKYTGTDYYSPSSTNATIKVKDKVKAIIAITMIDGNCNVTGIVKDANGEILANAPITYTVNGGEKQKITTAEDGSFVIAGEPNCVIAIEYTGTAAYGSNATITLKDINPQRTATKIDSADYTTYSIDFKAGERGNYFKVQLLDADGKALANKAVKIGFNGVVYDRVTDSEGRAQLQINLKNAGVYTFAVAFLGDDDYNGSFVVNKITVNVKTTQISAPAKTFKASAKTKSYAVTLTTIKGSSLDGKTYMEAGKQIKLTINGKTYTANTNSKGQATFKLSLTKKGSYSGTVSFAGDKAYAASKATAKIKIN